MTFRARAAVFAAALASLPFAAACTNQLAETAAGSGIASDPAQPGTDPATEPAFEIGTGNYGEFGALGPGVTVPVTYGLQGGTHIWFAARCRNLGVHAALTYSITDTDGGVVSAEQSVMLPTDPGEDGWRMVSGLTAFIDGPVPAEQGMTVVFHGHLEDDDGHVFDATGNAVVNGTGF